MKFILLKLFGNIVEPLLIIISKFYNFKFCHIHSTRLGHLTLNFDNALLSINKKTILLCSNDNKISNRFILNVFKKQKKVFFNKIFKYVYFSILYYNPSSNLIISWKDYQPKFSYYHIKKSRIKFPNYSKRKLESILSKFNLKKNFVCLQSRDDLYVKKNHPEDTNYHSFRNSNFKDYELVIDYLHSKNFSIVKIGDCLSKENLLFCKKKGVLTSLDYGGCPELDFIFNAYSKFNVVNNSGVQHLSTILRKKIVYTNFIPFNLPLLSYCSPSSIMIPKKIYNIKQKKFLNFQECLKLNFSIHEKDDPYKRNKFKVINNTPEELLNCIKEMERQVSIKNFDKKFSLLQKKFWNSLRNDHNFKEVNYLKKKLKLKISNFFLKENLRLF